MCGEHSILASQTGQGVPGFKGKNAKLSFFKEQNYKILEKSKQTAPACTPSALAVVCRKSTMIEFANHLESRQEL